VVDLRGLTGGRRTLAVGFIYASPLRPVGAGQYRRAESGNQLDALRAEAARRGLEIIAEYVLDGLSAWTGAHRKQLRRALDDARSGGHEVLLVWALDRLERGGIEPTLRVMRQLRERGVLVASLQEPWTEAGGEMQELLAAIMAWIVRMESQRRSERVRAGLARRKAAGLPVGRPPGAKDKARRRRSGYVTRWERERVAVR
jgi:putative DNA-invertase from lambdoid prophage Rac